MTGRVQQDEPAAPGVAPASPAPAVPDAAPPVLAVLLVLLVGGTTLAALATTGALAPALIADPGALTRWGLPLARGVADLAGAVTVGALVVTAFVLPAPVDGRRRLVGAAAGGALLAAAAAAVWSVASVAVLLLGYSEIAGEPLGAPGTGAGLISYVTSVDQGRSLAAAAVLVVLTTFVATSAARLTTVGVAAALSVLSLLPTALTGHAANAANHEAAVNTQALHLVGLSVWVGGLVTVWCLRGRLGDHLAVVVARYSRVALWAFVAVGVSGVAGGLLRVGGVAGLTSTYGVLLGGKAVLLVVLGAFGWAHRRRTVPAVAAGGAAARRAFARLALAELAVMAVATGLGVALGRTSPPPAPSAQQDPTTELLGYPMPPPLAFEQWFTQWQLDSLWTAVAVVAAALYVGAVVRLRRRGDRWSTPRTLAWLGGCLALVYATGGAPGAYGRVLFSMHMVEHMTIGTLVPILLVLGAPVTLALRALRVRTDGSRGPREWLLVVVHSRVFAVLGHVAVAPPLFVASLVAFYYTPVFDLALSTHVGHVLMTTHFIVVGYLFAWVVCGPDPGPRRPVFPVRLLVLIITMAFHALFGIALMSSTTALGADWFGALDRSWGPTLLQDQYRGGALAWALGDYPVGLLAVALAWAWIREDERESRRFDRRAERDGDAELHRYNAMLGEMAERVPHGAVRRGRTAAPGAADEAPAADGPGTGTRAVDPDRG